jgi:guanine deaminase
MCLGAICWARIPDVFFACTRDDAAAAGFQDADLYRALSATGITQGTPVLRRMPSAAAAAAMAAWRAKADRVPY